MHVLMQVLNVSLIDFIVHRTVTIFWPVTCYEVIQGLEHWMKLLCLDQPVVMNFRPFFLISSMERGTVIL